MTQIDIALELLREGRTVTIVGRGNSMRPYLVHERDRIMLSPAASVEVGDVVLATLADGRHVLHRVVRKEDDRLKLLGDGNMTGEQCTLNDVRGKAIGYIRKGRSEVESPDSFGYRCYAWTWRHLPLFIRRCVLALHNIVFHSRKDLTHLMPRL